MPYRKAPVALPPSRLQHPPDIAAQRHQLFEPAEPVILAAEEYIIYWPYVSKLWHLRKMDKVAASKGTVNLTGNVVSGERKPPSHKVRVYETVQSAALSHVACVILRRKI